MIKGGELVWAKRALDAVLVFIGIAIVGLFCALVAVQMFGISVYVVKSGSMEPAIKTGSAVYVKTGIEGEDVEPNEVIAFDIGGAQNSVCTHRVVDNDTDSQSIQTKGDANEQEDAARINYDRLVGRVVMSIPYLGFIVAFIFENKLVVFMSVAATFFLAFLLSRLLKAKSVDSNNKETGKCIMDDCWE